MPYLQSQPNQRQMTKTEWNDLYIKLYDAYSSSILKDDYVRSSLADAIDHMIMLKEKGMVRTVAELTTAA